MGWKERHTVIPAVYLILRRGKQMLLIRRYQTGYLDGFYSLPAGHLDGGEPATKAAIRETAEEVGAEVRSGDIRLVHTMHRVAASRDHERVDLFFETTRWAGEPRIMEPHKCDDLRWFDVAKLPKNIVPEVRQAIEAIAVAMPYSEVGFER